MTHRRASAVRRRRGDRRRRSGRPGPRHPARPARPLGRDPRAVARALPAAAGRALRPRGRPHPPVVRHRRRAPRHHRARRDLRVAQRSGHDPAALRPGRARPRRVGPSRRCSASPTLEAPARPAGRVAARRSRCAARRRSSTHGDHVERQPRTDVGSSSCERPAAPTVRAGYVVGCDGANSDRPRPARGARRRPRVLLRLAHRRRDPRRAAGLRSDQPADLRPGPPDDGGVGRSRPAALGVHAPARTRRIEELNDEPRAWELLAPWDVHPGNARLERHAVYTFQARVRRAVACRSGASSPATPPTRCRRSPGRACAPASATPPTWRGSSTSCSPAGPAAACSTPTTRSGCPSARAADRLLDRAGQGHLRARSRPRPRHATRPWRPGSTAELSEAPGLPGIATRRRAARRRRTPASCSSRAPSTAGCSTTSVASAGAWSPSTPTPRDLDPAMTRLVRQPSAVRVVEVGDDSDGPAAWFADHGVEWALQRPDFHLYGTAADRGRRRVLLAELRDRLSPSAVHHDRTRETLMKLANLDGRARPRPRRRRRRRRDGVRRTIRPRPDARLRRLGRVRRVRRRRHRPARSARCEPASAARCPSPARSSPSASTTGATPRSPGMAVPEVPATFTKFPASLRGPVRRRRDRRRHRRLGGRAGRGHRRASRPGRRGRCLVARGRADRRPGHQRPHAAVRGGHAVLAGQVPTRLRPDGTVAGHPRRGRRPRRPRARLLGRRRDRAGRPHERPHLRRRRG